MNKLEECKKYLNQLPDGYRERALSQINEECVNDTSVTDTVLTAIFKFCNWEDTEEGEDFWGNVYDHYEYGNPLPLLPNDGDTVQATVQATEHHMSDSEAWVRFASGLAIRMDLSADDVAYEADEMLKEYQKRFGGTNQPK